MAIDLPDIEWDPLWALVAAAIATGVGGAITAVVKGAPASACRQARSWRTTRREARDEELRADHFVITTGWSKGDVVGSNLGFVACIRAAPAKNFPERVRLDVNRVAPLVRSAFGDLFSSDPEVSIPTEVVRFRPQDSSLGGGELYQQVWSSGLFEATVPIPHTVTESGELHLPLLEIARSLLPSIQALQRGGYEDGFGPAVEIPLGLDWELKVSRQMSGATSTPWDALEFPGQAAERATGQGPPWTTPGFGHDQLLSVPITTAPEDILMPAFEDFLDRAGYYGTEGALEDLRTALRNLRDQVETSESARSADGELPPVESAE